MACPPRKIATSAPLQATRELGVAWLDATDDLSRPAPRSAYAGRSTTTSSPLVLDVLSVEADLARDATIAGVQHDPGRNLSAGAAVVGLGDAALLELDPKFRQGLRPQNLHGASRDRLAGENAGLGFGEHTDTQSNQGAPSNHPAQCTAHLGGVPEGLQFAANDDVVPQVLDGALDAIDSVHDWSL